MKNKILVAVDISERTSSIVNQALILADKMDASLVISSIIPIYVDYLQAQMAMVPTGWDEMYDNQKKLALQELQKIKDKYPGREIVIDVQIGNPKFDIIEKAKAENATYIVMGTHGHTGITHAVLGSTAEYIIRHATVPVLVVPMDTNEH
jgi:nucleotide-binding universal stress UspA family protein